MKEADNKRGFYLEWISGPQVQAEYRWLDGVDYILLTGSSAQGKDKTVCRIVVPGRRTHYRWTPKLHLIKGLNLDWFQNLYRTNGFTGAPVECLLDVDGRNSFTVGLSDTLNMIRFQAVVIEETAEYAFEIETAYPDNLLIRVDRREISYVQALRDMAKWWESLPGLEPAKTPGAALEPMYSTWYSFHQNMQEEALLEECTLAVEYGCRTVLLDDGWQTDDNNRGYAYCGDWKPAASKIPDMREFVQKIHGLGMKVMTWYSVPFMGEKSENYKEYKDMLIDPENDREWYVLDPRYPKVREFIIGLYEKALMEYDLDGFKLDFVDEFVLTPFSGKRSDERRDIEDAGAAADRLMKDCIIRLKAVKPDILLEFRQTYNGPRMRTYGNIFRAVDCPLDDVENHRRVTDIRLLCADSAVHSDMLMWDIQDTPESAALQFIQILFSVPQISVRLAGLPETHKKMLRFYLKIWNSYKGAFVQGEFLPGNPIRCYSVVIGQDDTALACSCHGPEVVTLTGLRPRMLFVNGSGGEGMYLDNQAEEAPFYVTVYDCMGNVIQQGQQLLTMGLQGAPVPVSGMIEYRIEEKA